MTDSTTGASTADLYDPAPAVDFFDWFGEREWERLDASLASRMYLELHTAALESHVSPGQDVLEVGAGPGRFTIVLGRLGARVTVADISPVQLRLNREHVTEAGLDGAVTAWHELDVTDMSVLPDRAFDSVVCFGSALSNTMRAADQAVGEMMRVLRPGGRLMISVSSRIGYLAATLPTILELARTAPARALIDDAVHSGDLWAGLPNQIASHFYTGEELTGLLRRHGADVLETQSTGFFTAYAGQVPAVALDQATDLLDLLLRREAEAVRERGTVDCGSHLLCVATAPHQQDSQEISQ